MFSLEICVFRSSAQFFIAFFVVVFFVVIELYELFVYFGD